MVTSSHLKTFQFPEVRVVEASAGSGKTYALAKRYIQLLLNPSLHLEQIPIRNILAITFTNKAAFEMKARILEFLKTIALGQLSPQEEEEILKPIGITQAKAQKKAFVIMDSLIRHYNFFQVQTIDKFINALLSGCSFKIGLTANFKIKTNSDEYLQYSLDELIDRASTDKGVRRTFEQFLHNYLYLENRTGWFPKQDILSIISTLFTQLNAYGRQFQEGPYLAEDVIKKKRYILDQMKELKEILPKGTDGRFLKSLDKFLSNHNKGFDIDSVSNYFTYEFLPLKKNAKSTKMADKFWSKIKSNLTELCEQEAYSLFNPYISVFQLVLTGMVSQASKDDVLFLSELNKKAGSLFDEEHITVQELYYRLATRFRHYLIDEFQDTSRLQWNNLEEMAKEALSTGGSLFYVGDRKQAIYGFRGGEVELFDDIKEKFYNFNVQLDLLTKNWRSQKAIVEFNNAVFSLDNIKAMIQQKQNYEDKKSKDPNILFNEEDIKEVEDIFVNAQQTHRQENKDGFVNVEFIDEDKKEDREEIIRERVIELVTDLAKRFKPRDIAILTRSNSQIEQLTTWLLEEGIQVDSERTSNIKENEIIQELVFFLQFLNSPIDNMAFSKFILGDLFSKATGIATEEMHEFLFSLRERLAKEKSFYIYTEFRKKYKAIWDKFLNEFFQNVGIYPLYEIVVSIYSRFNVLTNFSQYQGYLMHFLELIKSQEDEYADTQSFLEYFDECEGEELFVSLGERNAVRILTIHKAKGLEFPVVILPYLGMNIQVGTQGDNQQSYILLKEKETIKLVRRKKQYLKFSEHLYNIYRQEYKRAFISELNNIYVALTRAQAELYCFIPKKVGSSFNYAQFLIPENLYQVGRPAKFTPDSSRQPGEHLNISPSVYRDWIEYLKDEFHDADELRNRQERLRGEVIHFILSKMDNLKGTDTEDAIERARSLAQYQYPHVQSFDEYIKVAKKIIGKKELKEFFFVDKGDVFNEKEVIDRNGITKRIDRLVVKDDETWIIDFKSSKSETGTYQDQVKEYMKIIADIYPRKKVKGYLVYFDSFKLEEIHG